MTAIDLSFRPHAYWPADAPPAGDEDVVIATILLESTLSDVIWVVAAPEGDRIRYAIRDEYEMKHGVQPETSDEPLSLGELIELIDTAELVDDPQLDAGVVYRALSMNLMIGSGNEADIGFVLVQSDVYPGLSEHYQRAVRGWVMGVDGA